MVMYRQSIAHRNPMLQDPHFNTTKEETMNLYHQLAIESRHVRRRSKRLFQLLVSKDARARRRYFKDRIQASTNAWIDLVQYGERNPAYDLPGADPHLVDRYTLPTTVLYHLGMALIAARLSLDFMSYSEERGYEEGKRLARYELQRDIVQISIWTIAARENEISIDSLIKEHPWAETYLSP